MGQNVTKLAGAFRVLQRLYIDGGLKGDRSESSAPYLMENDIIHEIRKHKDITEEDAIDLADTLNILNVIPANDDGSFTFNEEFRNANFNEVLVAHEASKRHGELSDD